MSKLALAILVALLLGGLFGTFMAKDPGYVLIAYDGSSVETSVWFALVILLVAYAALRSLVYLFVRMMGTPGGLQRWNQGRRLRASRKQTARGLLLIEEERWGEAKKALSNSAPRSETPLVNYLGAAQAAQALGQLEDRDALLEQAREQTPGSKLALTLAQARLQVDTGQWAQALITLEPLQKTAGKNVAVATLLARCYAQTGDMEALYSVLPLVRKQQNELAGVYEAMVWRSRLAQSLSDANNESSKALATANKIWRKTPKQVRQDSQLLHDYAELLLQQDCFDAAAKVLQDHLAENWQANTVDLYGRIQPSDLAAHRKTAEGWLKRHSNDAALLLSLGRICAMQQDWAQAREYFESSLRIQASEAVYRELIRTCLATQELERAQQFSQAQALLLTQGATEQAQVAMNAQASESRDTSEVSPAAHAN